MRHHNANRKFGRETDGRRALLRSLAEGLLEHGKITTTEAKAKELRPFIEKLITKARTPSVGTRRLLSSRLGTQARMESLIAAVAKKYQEQAGGYTRIIKIPKRISDGSPMAIIELL